MRWVGMGLASLVLLASGCQTEAVSRGHVRATKYAKSRAEKGDVLGAAVAEEMTVANAMTGADKVPEDAVPLTVEASKANTGVLKTQLKRKQLFKKVLLGVKDWAVGNAPWLGGLLSVLGVAGVLAKKLLSKGKALDAAVRLTGKVKDAIKGEGSALDKFKAVYAAGKADGKDFVKGSKELYGEYKKLKSKGKTA